MSGALSEAMTCNNVTHHICESIGCGKQAHDAKVQTTHKGGTGRRTEVAPALARRHRLLNRCALIGLVGDARGRGPRAALEQ